MIVFLATQVSGLACARDQPAQQPQGYGPPQQGQPQQGYNQPQQGYGQLSPFPRLNDASVKTTEGNAREIRNAVQRWRGLKGSTDCPTISQLVQDREIDSASKTADAWGTAFKITCTQDDVIVLSPGPDRTLGTKDDISVARGH